jgi:3-hydroxymyristoyl/3-hydroxydecanoyl-(acyl carrier protein) dehydratase
VSDGSAARPLSAWPFVPRPRPGSSGIFDLHVPPDLAYFRGHFPGEPILAGVVQIELVLEHVALTWPDLARLVGIRLLRFRRPIHPGDDLELAVERSAPERVDFEITRQRVRCSSGTLEFRLSAPP